ncbi:hypothetical protein [Leeia sp.]|uniref:hypothetical protein n=1 Tax=Leeia sp. TaxID=2884678 RepID=UPI0035B20005
MSVYLWLWLLAAWANVGWWERHAQHEPAPCLPEARGLHALGMGGLLAMANLTGWLLRRASLPLSAWLWSGLLLLLVLLISGLGWRMLRRHHPAQYAALRRDTPFKLACLLWLMVPLLMAPLGTQWCAVLLIGALAGVCFIMMVPVLLQLHLRLPMAELPAEVQGWPIRLLMVWLSGLALSGVLHGVLA